MQKASDTDGTPPPYVFVSYAAAAKDRVSPLVQALVEHGFDLWVDDPSSLSCPSETKARLESLRESISKPWKAQLDAAVDHASCVLVCLSKEAAPEGQEPFTGRLEWYAEIVAGRDKAVFCAVDDVDARGLSARFNAVQVRRFRTERGVLLDPEVQLDLLVRDITAVMDEQRSLRAPELEADTVAATGAAFGTATASASATTEAEPPRPSSVLEAARAGHERARTWLKGAADWLAARRRPSPEATARPAASRPVIWALRVGAGLLVLVAAALGLSFLALADIVALSRRPAEPPLALDLGGESGRPVRVVAASDGTIRVLNAAGQIAQPGGLINGTGSPVVQATLVGDRVLFVDALGRTRLAKPVVSPLRRTMVARQPWEALLDEIWAPFGRPVAFAVLGWTARVLPLDMPAGARGGRGRSFQDCFDCPTMVELTPGWFFGSVMPGGSRTLQRVVKPFAIGRRAVSNLQWSRCADEGVCRAIAYPEDQGAQPVRGVSSEEARAYANWLSDALGSRRYGVATHLARAFAVTGPDVWRTDLLDSGILNDLVADCAELPFDASQVCSTYSSVEDHSGNPPYLLAGFRLVASVSGAPGTRMTAVAGAAAPETAFPGLRPRVYVHIAAAAERAAARRFELALESADLGGGVTPIVPGIQVRGGPRAGVLRCFTPVDCDRAGPLLDAINARLAAPLTLQDASATFVRADIRENHYEIWFAPGAFP